MSGLCGIFDFGGNILTRHLETMLFMLTHRGTGEPGVWRDGNVCFGFWDLKALDEERRSPQPLRDEKENVCVLFDGRLDNREMLLEKLGWQDATDVELVAGGYAHWKGSVFKKLLGDFAIAIWDVSENKLVLARDPVGLKPLFYYKDSQRFIFASEAKAILHLPEVRRAPDEMFLRAFYKGKLREKPETFFEGICRVCPGETVMVKREGMFRQTFWEPDFQKKIKRCLDEEYRDEFKEHFYSAVKTRLPEKGKATVFLSGGLDSSSVTSVAADIVRKEKMPVEIETFSMISDRFPDERSYSSCVAQAHGLLNATVNMDALDMMSSLEEMVFEFESPLVGPQDVFFGALFKKASFRGAKVLLTGEWGDQLMFSGAYLADLLLEGKWSVFLKEFFPFCAYERVPKLYMIKRLLSCLLSPRRKIPGFQTQAQRELYDAVFAPFNVVVMETMERAAAHAGFELRMPFLDMRLFDFLLGVPSGQRMRDGLGKRILREALKGILPERVAGRTEKTDYTVCLLPRLCEVGFNASSIEGATRLWDAHAQTMWRKTWFASAS